VKKPGLNSPRPLTGAFALRSYVTAAGEKKFGHMSSFPSMLFTSKCHKESLSANDWLVGQGRRLVVLYKRMLPKIVVW
jgi:hypothetical protein